MPDRKETCSKSMDTIDWDELESLLSDEDRIKYSSMTGDEAHEFLITNPLLDSTTARNLRVRYVLFKAAEEGRIKESNIELHDQLFKALGEIMMKEDRRHGRTSVAGSRSASNRAKSSVAAGKCSFASRGLTARISEGVVVTGCVAREVTRNSP